MNEQIKEILAVKGTNVYSVGPEASIMEAVTEMDVRGVGSLLVIANDLPVGIVTERDVLRRVVAANRSPSETRVSEVMTREVVAIHPEATVADAMALVDSKRCRHLPVVDDGKVVGIISSGDLTHWESRNHEFEIKQLVDYITGKYPG